MDAPVAAEEAHATHAGNAFADPLVLILVRLIHQRVRLDVAVEVIAHEVVIAVVDNGVAESGEAARVAEHVTLDGVEDFLEVRVQLEGAVGVGVAEVFHVLGEIAEEEDIVFADLTGDFDLECVSYVLRARDLKGHM